MNTKEAIEFLKFHRILHYDVTQEDGIDKVIDLLQQGEKYKQVMIDLENALLPEQWEVVEIIIEKYFPKE